MASAASMTLGQLAAFLDRRAEDLARIDFTEPLKQAAQALRSDVLENFQGGHAPDGAPWAPVRHARAHGRGDSSQPLHDRGLLSASVTSPTEKGHIERITDTSLVMGTTFDYAAIHQFGGVIRPVSAKALAIPLTSDAWRAGRARNFPRPLFLFKSAGGKRLLAEAKDRGRGKKTWTELIFHYVLASQVTVPARPFLGFSERLVGKLEVLFGNFLERMLGGGGGTGGNSGGG